jgi:hypothetical protein
MIVSTKSEEVELEDKENDMAEVVRGALTPYLEGPWALTV